MRIQEILHAKGHRVVTIAGDRTVFDALKILVDEDIGSLVVVEGDRSAGIFTERDVLRLAATGAGKLGSTKVSEVMTRDLVTATPDDRLLPVMEVMTKRRIRHLPVLEADRMVGIVSIGDLLNACREKAEEENTHLRDYIQGSSW